MSEEEKKSEVFEDGLKEDGAYNKSVNELLNAPNCKPFLDKLESSIREIKKHKFLDYKNTIEELSNVRTDVSVNVESIEDLDNYLPVMDKIQSYIDRVTQITNRAHSDFLTIDGHYKHLIHLWAKFSSEKSDKKKENEAEFVMGVWVNESIKRQDLYESCKRVLENLTKRWEHMSRKAAIIMHIHTNSGMTYPKTMKIPQSFSTEADASQVVKK